MPSGRPVKASSAEAGKPITRLPPIPAGAADVFEDVTGKSGITFTQQFCEEKIANIIPVQIHTGLSGKIQ